MPKRENYQSHSERIQNYKTKNINNLINVTYLVISIVLGR